jgi:hypothetical protein
MSNVVQTCSFKHNAVLQEGACPVRWLAFHKPASRPPHHYREPEDHRQQDILQDRGHQPDIDLQGTVPYPLWMETLASVAEPCHCDMVPVPIQVPTCYFSSYGTGSGSLHNYKKIPVPVLIVAK